MPLALSAAAALLLSGCNGDGGNGQESPSPSTTSGSSSTTSPSSSASATEPSESPTPQPATSTSAAKNIPAPEMPAAMKKNDKAGLEAALKYWFETNYYLKSTGDPEPMKVASSESCAMCKELMETWPEIYELGGWADLEPAQLSDVFANVDQGGGGGTWLFSLTEKLGVIYKPDGTPVKRKESDKAGTLHMSGSAVFNKKLGHWQFESLGILK